MTKSWAGSPSPRLRRFPCCSSIHDRFSVFRSSPSAWQVVLSLVDQRIERHQLPKRFAVHYGPRPTNGYLVMDLAFR